ncbi:MAG: DNA-directed RNA polymerase subunit beta [Alphaproteobacteria bacterium]|nr:MAG: DNA-directed RNA polymerase subunit beta [Alphaproteobacteria bacterium]
MANSFTSRHRLRKSYASIEAVAEVPDLIGLQKSSFADFLQMSTAPADRGLCGIQEVFHSVFPIVGYSGRAHLEFLSYEMGSPEYDEDECRYRGLTYATPLRATFRLVVWDIDEDTGARSIRDIKEQTIYMGDMPMMTDHGTFIVNGVERVIVSQMHRSPGVFFDHDFGKTHASGKYLFSARVIPYRGSWLDLEFDAKDILYVRIDRKRKVPVTTLLMCLDNADTANKRLKAGVLDAFPSASLDFEVAGMSREDILNTFYAPQQVTQKNKSWSIPFDAEAWRSQKLTDDLVDATSGSVLVEKGTRLTPRILKKLAEQKVTNILVSSESLMGRFVARTLTNKSTGEVIAEAGDEITDTLLASLDAHNVTSFEILNIDFVHVGPYLRNTLAIDKNMSRAEALADIYRVLRPGEPPTLEGSEALFYGLFFDKDKYDLSAVGRVKMNSRLGLSLPDDHRVLSRDDIIRMIKILLELKDGRGDIDDIDNLANRRVRSVGELLENHYRLGLLRMERTIRERMGSVDIETAMPHDLINAKPAAASLREFFGSSQLSQFMDQTNPLSEVTHKRRLSALGPGGLSRDRATFEVRDVHPTHYGRICPIETPEGQNIGLINSLASYARVNKYGFIETPYRKVVDGKVTSDVLYLSAMEEWRCTIAQANAPVNDNGTFEQEFVNCRKAGDFIIAPPGDVDYIDVSPKQVVSVAAALVPFLENDDGNRALMGANMQRQAVPLIVSEAPLVGTGMEKVVAQDSGVVIRARHSGVVDQVDANRIVVRVDVSDNDGTPGVDIYNLKKYQRTNHSTCLNQRPIVCVGDMVTKGDVIVDGPSTDEGELALGRNVLVGFLSWNGYNFEDSIIISERIARDDVFTSIHLDEFEIMARDTKLGHEEITRDIPNVGDEALRHLDETGIVSIGAEVEPGDILVGKVTPKGEAPVTPEEKLLRAIFGEKASDVRDSSMRVPPGITGTVVDVRVFSRRGVEKDERALAIEQAEISRMVNDREDERKILERAFYANLREVLLGNVVAKTHKDMKKGTEITENALETLGKLEWKNITVSDEAVVLTLDAIKKKHLETIDALMERYDHKIEKLRRGDELAPGVLKMVKVFIAVKRKLQPGDKMAGRHGNKGVVSFVAPIEDMPYLEDGTPVDMILNPLGLPSRMNVGQILETHLGWASAGLGHQVRALLDKVEKDGTGKTEDLRQGLKAIYHNTKDAKEIDARSDDEILRMSARLSHGVPMATPVFDGAHEGDIVDELERAGLDVSGQVTLYDGRTGEAFDRSVTVGYMYILKLHHLVDDKIHARSIGRYSLVTQQPLGGKAQFGGQRFGEMEVWALEAYGAAYTLQEMLTVKSDDVSGRTKVYESIVRGDTTFEAGVPESFNVLVQELRSLCLNIELGKQAA